MKLKFRAPVLNRVKHYIDTHRIIWGMVECMELEIDQNSEYCIETRASIQVLWNMIRVQYTQAERDNLWKRYRSEFSKPF